MRFRALHHIPSVRFYGNIFKVYSFYVYIHISKNFMHIRNENFPVPVVKLKYRIFKTCIRRE
jgi:hypothetical protein